MLVALDVKRSMTHRNIQILSDLHFEFHRDSGTSFLDSLDPSEVDILILAGDIATSDILLDAIGGFCRMFPQVVMVAGNHEYYHSDPESVTRLLMRAEAKYDNFCWLNNDLRTVDGVRFLGGTLWFPQPTPDIWHNRHQMNDFRVIRGFEPWVYDQNQACVDAIHRYADRADVIVTHHLPALECVDPRYRGSTLNHYFVHDMTRFIEKCDVPLWVYGHTHTSMDFHIGQTRMVSNPLGYPLESKKGRGEYREKLLIKVPCSESDHRS